MKEMRMKPQAPDYIRSIKPYKPGKPIEELEREYGIKNSIKLASNENPLGPSPRAMAAMQAAMGNLHRYPDGSGYYLIRKLAEKLAMGRAGLFWATAPTMSSACWPGRI
jgi:histidinol-phosphate aminotransferase